MTAFTQTAIRQTFLKLLETTPIDKITVRMIVDHCGVSRNTFYYHYADIPALMRDLIDTELTRIAEETRQLDDLQAKAARFLTLLAAHRGFFDRLYRSEYRDRLQQRMLQAANQVAMAALTQRGGGELDPAVQKTIASFFAGAFLGICTQWLREGAQEAPELLAGRMHLFEGLMDEVILRAKTK